MNCVICKHGVLRDGTTTLTLERNGALLVFKDIPARVCDNCGEACLDDAVTQQLLSDAERATDAGVEVDVRHYVAA